MEPAAPESIICCRPYLQVRKMPVRFVPMIRVHFSRARS